MSIRVETLNNKYISKAVDIKLSEQKETKCSVSNVHSQSLFSGELSGLLLLALFTGMIVELTFRLIASLNYESMIMNAIKYAVVIFRIVIVISLVWYILAISQTPCDPLAKWVLPLMHFTGGYLIILFIAWLLWDRKKENKLSEIKREKPEKMEKKEEEDDDGIL